MAVLIIGYQRKKEIQAVIKSVSKFKPDKLYLAMDGPKINNEISKLNCENARDAALKEITWKCEIFTKFSSSNCGLRKFMFSSIDWFFTYEKEGLILEDDIILFPNPKLVGLQNAIENNFPYIFFSCSGGQRMHESSIALMQMSRTALAVNELKKKNIPFIVILTNPTTGGVTASWAMLGDILISEPKSVIGFAGRRVIQDTVRETLPDDFQTAEYVKDHGGLDLIVERKYLNSTIGTLLTVMLKKEETQVKNTTNVVTIDKSLQSAG